MSRVVEEPPAQHQAHRVHGNDSLQGLETGGMGDGGWGYGSIQQVGVDGGVVVGAGLTLAAVKVNMGRKMTASLASGILVQTAANMVMMAPD